MKKILMICMTGLTVLIFTGVTFALDDEDDIMTRHEKRMEKLQAANLTKNLKAESVIKVGRPKQSIGLPDAVAAIEAARDALNTLPAPEPVDHPIGPQPIQILMTPWPSGGGERPMPAAPELIDYSEYLTDYDRPANRPTTDRAVAEENPDAVLTVTPGKPVSPGSLIRPPFQLSDPTEEEENPDAVLTVTPGKSVLPGSLIRPPFQLSDPTEEEENPDVVFTVKPADGINPVEIKPVNTPDGINPVEIKPVNTPDEIIKVDVNGPIHGVPTVMPKPPVLDPTLRQLKDPETGQEVGQRKSVEAQVELKGNGKNYTVSGQMADASQQAVVPTQKKQ